MPSSTSTNKPAQSMAELMARTGNNVQTLQKGQLIEGTIKKLTPGEILMDIGAKGDALVIEYDHQNLENLLSFLKVGDRVTASVISPEAEEGFPVLSLRRTLDDIIYKKFEDLTKGDSAFEVEVTEPTKGGYFARTLEGVRGFLPSSQVLDVADLSGKKIQVKILEFDRAKKRVLFSQKALSYIMNPAQIAKYVKKGDSFEVVVASVTPYGLYVIISPEKDVKIEGFIHISEVAYEHVSDLSSKFKIGDKIKVEALDIDDNNKRVNLSIKKTQKDTFVDIRSKYKLEDKLRVTVKDVKTRGVTVEVAAASGPEGLRPGGGVNGFISSDKVPSGKTYEVGQTLEAEVIGFDDRRRVILLSPVLTTVPIGYR